MNHGTRPLVLAVDDSPEVLQFIDSVLGDDYRLRLATSGRRALQLARQRPVPDCILLDVVMPHLDGFYVCKQLHNDYASRNIPIIIVTASDDLVAESRGFACGCRDFIKKPISAPILRARVNAQIELKRAREELEDYSHQLELDVAKRTNEIRLLQDTLVVAMGHLAELRDNETGLHIQRTRYFVQAIGRQLMRQSGFRERISDALVDMMFSTAGLHDIGKVGIPDAVLQKPGPLTDAEFEIMKRHTALGLEAIEVAERTLNADASLMPVLTVAKQIIYSHHERWNGLGYPQGLAGEDIPLPARIMAVADIYDALTNERVYKEAIPHQEALGMIAELAGNHLQAEIVDAFLSIAPAVKQIAERFREPRLPVAVP
ncbi:response regulator [Synechococcus sp. RSCCF101]|uniref:HD-GYP domain-containing protein n=1 Tax=Synechococcus sp. RSCCF101 TaxID=2511069 RepID=UPI001247C64B|nr:HD domain-containing phosphohydrolase [Synechococcus sp. RSCCF101]QEY31213.1 response regulator [Synechococcus sp. RSCCF101]